MSILITICARGGSKGIPNKNLANLGNYPLLSYSAKAGKKFGEKYSADYGFSTDRSEIRDLASKYGFITDYARPEFLATDSAGKIEAIYDLLIYEESRNKKKYDFVLDLDITSPLRTVKDLEESFKILLSDENAYNVFSVSKPHRNPYFNQVEKDISGYFKLVKIPEIPIKSRQTAPKVWDLNASIYIYRRKFFDHGFQNAYTDKSLIYEMPHMCFDLDEKIDFEIMSYLISNNKLDFEFDYL
ncbi:MAG: acylneuraminate cytidylyltransferase family protein [Ignavibacteriaceae bacterium]|nr:acylneuraminate cytidylyltransferase family protein [Ignavibacteriaceae bacterium]